MDLILEKGQRRIAVEIELSSAPIPGKGFWNAIKFLKPTESWIIGHVDSTYPGPEGVVITNLEGFLKNFRKNQ